MFIALNVSLCSSLLCLISFVCCVSVFICLKICSIISCDFFFDPLVVCCVLFDVHIFVIFLAFLPLKSNFIPLGLDKTF